MGFKAENIAFPALRMLMEKTFVSKREDHIFDACVADLSSLTTACFEVVQGRPCPRLVQAVCTAISRSISCFLDVKLNHAALRQFFSIWEI
jgi:hypothetical protein